MVDVSGKDVTARRAQAQGRFVTTPEVIALLRRDGLPKGDALAVARIAGIMGAKRASELIPLCHPVALHGVTLDLDLGDDAVTITATTRTADRTGVEMEALSAVAAAGLTLYDMVKAVDRGAVLGEIRLLAKDGGRTGQWNRADRPETPADLAETPDRSDARADRPETAAQPETRTDLPDAGVDRLEIADRPDAGVDRAEVAARPDAGGARDSVPSGGGTKEGRS